MKLTFMEVEINRTDAKNVQQNVLILFCAGFLICYFAMLALTSCNSNCNSFLSMVKLLY